MIRMLKQREHLSQGDRLFPKKEKGIMKTKRIEAALFVYEQLLNGKKVRRDEVMDSLERSPATFKRLMSDIRCYLAEHRQDKELNYSKKEDLYEIDEVQM